MIKKRFLVLLGLAAVTHSVFGFGIRYTPPSLYGYHPLYDSVQITSPLLEEHPVVFDIKPSLFQDTAIIDFEKRQITFIRYDRATGAVVWQFHYAEFDEYFNSLRRYALAFLWNQRFKKSEQEKKKTGTPSLTFEMPISYPAWARRVLGKDPPKLSIKGYLQISFGYKSNTTATEGIQQVQGTRGGLFFDHNEMFAINGSIGRLINVEIKVGKEEKTTGAEVGNQIMDHLKIEYKPDPDSANQLEDDIIQEVVAGKTNFPMPGQGLAGYSGSHEGLFGIKVRSQLGPLSLTTIVSRENAESQEKTFDLTQNVSLPINETDYVRNVYFFLDSVYLKKYLNPAEAVPEISELRVYKLESIQSQSGDNENDFVWAIFGDSTANTKTAGRFRKLKEFDDYAYNKQKGWLWFLNTKPADNTVIAIYCSMSNGKVKGDTSLVDIPQINKKGLKKVWVLKNKEPESKFPNTDSTYFLAWRNVYPLPQDAKPEDFKIEVMRKIPGKESEKRNGDRLFSEILQITDASGNPKKEESSIYDFTQKYLIIPPYTDDSTKKANNKPFENKLLGPDNINDKMYYDTNETDEIDVKYEIKMSGTSKMTSLMLGGFGVVPNSETVKKNGSEALEKNKDYVIDYDVGMIDLISEKAKSATTIKVQYQQESAFMMESKTFLGAYGKLNLPGIGRESFLATSIMGQFVGAGDKVPRVGQEPFNRFLYDNNLHLDFEPEWMTRAVNLLPLVSTTAASSILFDFEVAYSNLVPDKDTKGEAFLDDFSNSSRDIPFGLGAETWSLASPSPDWDEDPLRHPVAWNSYWFSPVENDQQIHKDEIWQPGLNETQTSNYINTLRWRVQPLPTNAQLLSLVTDSINDSVLVNPYTGIMTPLFGSLSSVKKYRYFEFWVKLRDSTKCGRLYVDFGDVSEAVSVDGGWPDRMRNHNEMPLIQSAPFYDSAYDVGLDTLFDTAEVYRFPNLLSEQWEALRYGDPRLEEFKEDPNRDKWADYTSTSTGNRTKANGTERDGRLTSEDLNGDGFSLVENCFRATIDLRNPTASKFCDKEKTNKVYNKQSGWIFYRIPINMVDSTAFTIVSNSPGAKKPSWDNIKYIRFLRTDLSKDTNTLEFTEIKFSGSMWREVPSDSGKIKIFPSVLNTETDKGVYFRPPGTGIVDQSSKTKDTIKDYSLKLEYKDVKPGEEALIKRDIGAYQKIDITPYDEIFIYLNEIDAATHLWNGSKTIDYIKSPIVSKRDMVKFVFRFGYSDSCYYEFRVSSLKNHWGKGKELRFSLKRLAELKQEFLNKFGNNPNAILVLDTLPDGNRLKIYSTSKKMPSFSDIRWMAVGVVRDKEAVVGDLAEGEIWVNGLRVRGIKSVDGWAFRTTFATKWADFMDLSANLNYDDPGFRQMSEDPNMDKRAKIQASANAQWAINKFLPEDWGVSIPFGMSIGAALERPRMRPGTDILLYDENESPDRLGDMAGDFAGMLFNSRASNEKTAAEHYQKGILNSQIYASYSKTSYGKNPLVNFTADRITTNYAYTRDSSTEAEGLRPKAVMQVLSRRNVGEDHINVMTKRSHTAGLKYDLSPRNPPKWTSWSPFGQVASEKFPRNIKNYELKLLPNRFNFDLLSGSFVKEYTYRSLLDTNGRGEYRKEYLTMNHGLQWSYTPIAPLLEANYDIGISRNFDDALSAWGRDGTWSFVKTHVFAWDPAWKKYYIMYGEKARTQNAGLKVDPQLFEWLTTTADYAARYTQNPKTFGGVTGYLKTALGSEFNFNSSVRIRTLLTALSERFEKFKKAESFFDLLGNGLDKVDFNAVDFRYKAGMDLSNDNVGKDYLGDVDVWVYDFFKYQLGGKNRSFKDLITGNMNDYSSFLGVRQRMKMGYSQELYQFDSRNTNQDYTFSTSMRLPPPVEITFSPISLGWQRQYRVLPSEAVIDTTTVFPDFKAEAQTNVLEKIPAVKKTLTRLGMRTGYGFKKTVHKTYNSPADRSIRQDVTRGHSWAPLINLDGVIKKWPINLSYTWSFSRDSTVTLVGDTVSQHSGILKKNHTHVWTAKYTIPGKADRQINLLKRWTVPIKGDLTIGLTMNYGSNSIFKENLYFNLKNANKPDKDAYDEALMRSTDFSIAPELTYDFTDNINGLVTYLYQQTFDGQTKVKNTKNEFVLTVKIYFK